MRVVVVIPTYNEIENIEAIVRSVMALPNFLDLLIVDDGSPDGTGEVARGIGSLYPGRMQVLERTAKDGLGRAYLAAFDYVLQRWPHDIIIQMDADGSHDTKYIAQLILSLESGADLALGSRYVSGGRVEGWSAGRTLLSKLGNRYTRLVLGTQLRDLTGGFKAWRADSLGALKDNQIRSSGYGFQIESTMWVVAEGASVVEVPIVFRDRQQGKSKMSSRIALEALFAVPGLRRQLRAATKVNRSGCSIVLPPDDGLVIRADATHTSEAPVGVTLR